MKAKQWITIVFLVLMGGMSLGATEICSVLAVNRQLVSFEPNEVIVAAELVCYADATVYVKDGWDIQGEEPLVSIDRGKLDRVSVKLGGGTKRSFNVYQESQKLPTELKQFQEELSDPLWGMDVVNEAFSHQNTTLWFIFWDCTDPGLIGLRLKIGEPDKTARQILLVGYGGEWVAFDSDMIDESVDYQPTKSVAAKAVLTNPVGTVYYYADWGSNSNPGTKQSPWRDKAYAESLAVEGDVIVKLN